MKKIPLTQGQVALVDDDDFERLNQFKWCAHFQPNRANGGGYNAVRNAKRDGKAVTVLMHREILNAPHDKQVDHIDRDALNNQRSNLRLANPAPNGANQGLRKNNTSGYRGVYFFKGWGKYVAQIKVNGKVKNLGGFKTAEEAAIRYNEAAQAEYGEFAVLNSINKLEVTL